MSITISLISARLKQLLVIAIILLPFNAKSQLEGDIQIFSGGNAQFVFNTFTQYNEANSGGKTLTQKTTMKIHLTNSTQPYWKLFAWASEANFESSSGLIPINALELSIISVTEDSYSLIDGFDTPFSPTLIDQPLIWGHGDGSSNLSTISITITYKLTGDFLSLPSEEYFVQLLFELRTNAVDW